MSHPLTRVLTLLEILQSNAGLTGAELADRLDTDVRTVRRYIAHVRELGIPAEAERGRPARARRTTAANVLRLDFDHDHGVLVITEF